MEIRSLSIYLVATLFLGLPNNSRTAKSIRKQNYNDNELLQAMIYDALNTISWQLSGNERNKPASLFAVMTGQEKLTKKEKLKGFESGADFETYRKQLLERIE